MTVTEAATSDRFEIVEQAGGGRKAGPGDQVTAQLMIKLTITKHSWLKWEVLVDSGSILVVGMMFFCSKHD